MVTLSNHVSQVAGGRRSDAARGIRRAMILALIAAGASGFLMRAAEQAVDQLHPDAIKGLPGPVWIAVLRVLLLFGPYLLSFLLLSMRNPNLLAAGAGIAAGLFAGFLLASKGMVLGVVLAFGLSQAPFFLPTAALLLAFFAGSVWVVIAAVKIGKENLTVFVAAAALTLVIVSEGQGSLGKNEYLSKREAEMQQQADDFFHRPRPVGARQNLVYLASCLFQNHVAHPVYPKSIEEWWFCDTQFRENAVPGFQLSYTPRENPVNGYVTDFQLAAMPKKRGVANENPLMIDGRGIIFTMDPWVKGVPSRIVAMPSDREASQIDAFKRNIEQYMKEKNGGIAPAVLTTAIIGTFPLERPTIDASGARAETKKFRYVYLAPKPEAPRRFGIIAECKDYAQNCLRSFLLDYDGVIHGAGEPRSPIAEDPPALDCEIIPSECKDVNWSVR